MESGKGFYVLQPCMGPSQNNIDQIYTDRIDGHPDWRPTWDVNNPVDIFPQEFKIRYRREMELCDELLNRHDSMDHATERTK